MDDSIKITIEERSGKFIATTKLFPEYAGIGKTESDAIHKLGEVIITSIEDMVNKVIALVNNPKIERIGSMEALQTKMKMVDKLFALLEASPSNELSKLKLYMNNDINIMKDILPDVKKTDQLLYPFVQGPFMMNELGLSLDSAASPQDSASFIINMPINLN